MLTDIMNTTDRRDIAADQRWADEEAAVADGGHGGEGGAGSSAGDAAGVQ